MYLIIYIYIRIYIILYSLHAYGTGIIYCTHQLAMHHFGWFNPFFVDKTKLVWNAMIVEVEGDKLFPFLPFVQLENDAVSCETKRVWGGTPIHPPKRDYWKGSIAKPLIFRGGVKEYNPENWNLRTSFLWEGKLYSKTALWLLGPYQKLGLWHDSIDPFNRESS